MFTLLIMSFHSKHLVIDLVKSIDKNIPIVILENSQDYDLKDQLEKEHQNVKVIIPKENLGFAKGANGFTLFIPSLLTAITINLLYLI